MRCSPIGMPSLEKPEGTLEAVWPVMLMGKVKGRHPQNGSTSLPPITEGGSPMGNAGTAMVGVSNRSYSSKKTSI